MILQECSCFIEFIKRVKRKRSNVRFAEHFIVFYNEFNKFNNTEAQNVKFHFLHDSEISKNTFWRENLLILPNISQRYKGLHYVKLIIL